MRVLVSGAAGFLGSWFAKHHLQAGDAVVGVDDLSNEHSEWAPELIGNANLWEIDLQEYLDNATGDEFDLAYHFAAPVGGRLKIEGDPLFNADSLRLDSLFFRWAVGRVGTAIYPSSSAVYPVAMQTARGHSLHEGAFSATYPNWYAPDEMYGFTKLVGERLAAAASKYDLNTLCIRPFSGYGEGQSMEYPVPSIAARAIAREDPITVWGSGHQRRDFIHVQDLVGATVARLKHRVDGYEVLNLGSGYAHAFNDIARMCAEIVGYKPEITNDLEKPVGVHLRFADITRMRRYYQEPTISIRAGLTRVIESLS